MAVIHMFFVKHKNTAEIGRKLDIPEFTVDRYVAQELTRRAKVRGEE